MGVLRKLRWKLSVRERRETKLQRRVRRQSRFERWEIVKRAKARLAAQRRAIGKLGKAIDRIEEARERRREKRRVSSDNKWAGCRAVTNKAIRIVDGRAPVTSRKRWELFGNPDSAHYRGNKTKDGVDFGTAENYSLAREIARELGGEWSGDYDSFTITFKSRFWRRARRFTVQIIAGTHGTGPHLHVGVERV